MKGRWPSEPGSILLRPVEELNISVGAAELLKEANVYYIGDLVQRTGIELVDRWRIPERELSEIVRALRQRRLDLDHG